MMMETMARQRGSLRRILKKKREEKQREKKKMTIEIFENVVRLS
jgi:hypothetical protein